MSAANGGAVPVHAETVIAPGLARKAALIVQRDRFLRPVPSALLAVEVIVAVVLFVTGPVWAAVILLVVAAIGPVVVFATVGKLTEHLAATGFAPGTELEVDYLDDGFVLSTGGASNTMSYAEIMRLRTTRHLAVLRRRDAKTLFLLPVEAVPAEVRPRFGPAYRGRHGRRRP